MPGKIVVVDDDPLVGDLSSFLLTEAGYEVQVVQDSTKALETIRAVRPLLALLDILMPGVDGLTLCKQIKSDPELQSVKVAVVSGKSFDEEKARAAEYGADGFIQKPYNVETFSNQVKTLAGGGTVEEAIPAPPLAIFAPVPGAMLQIGIWGCRSLSAQKNRRGSRYGFNTSCVSVETPEHMFIFDAGSGLEALGTEIINSGRHKTLWIFLSHFHQDHILGLGSFPCNTKPGYKINICGINDADKTLEQMVQDAFENSPPSGSEQIQADFDLFEMKEESYDILPGVKVSPFYANHPSTTLGFVLQTEGRKFAYCPDSEIYGESATALQDYDEKLGGLCGESDLLIHDARYTDGDYQNRRNNGHSSCLNTVEFAGRNAVKRLVLFHHDDQYPDETLDKIAQDAAALITEKGLSLECVLAREGLRFGI